MDRMRRVIGSVAAVAYWWAVRSSVAKGSPSACTLCTYEHTKSNFGGHPPTPTPTVVSEELHGHRLFELGSFNHWKQMEKKIRDSTPDVSN